MKSEHSDALTPLDVCTLTAHDAVLLIGGGPNTRLTASEFRKGLMIFSKAYGLEDDAAPLLNWIDSRMESASYDSGGDRLKLAGSATPIFVPDVPTQTRTVWLFCQAIAWTKRQDERELLAQTLMDMGALTNTLLSSDVPADRFLTASDLRREYQEVQDAFQSQEEECQGATQAMQTL